MKKNSNKKKISRNSMLGFWSSLISPALLLYSAFTILNNPDRFYKIFPIFALGIIFYQIGIFFRKYGRRADKVFNKYLSKLDNKYSIFHFKTPVPHLIVGPAGIWILHPKYARGLITFNIKRKKWRIQRNSLVDKIFFLMNEGIGRPDFEISRQADLLDYYLDKNWPQDKNIQVNAVIVMMDEKAVVSPADYPIPTVHLSKLRGFLREKERENNNSITVQKAFIEMFE